MVHKMETKQIEVLKEVIKENEKEYNFSDYVFNYMDENSLKEIETIDDLRDYLEEINEDRYITNVEVIYYSKAIEYLKENDPSLNESVDIALECGYELKSINSEVLASLLQTRNNEEDYNDFIESVINDMEEHFN
jgi:hypothetical protein